ncbi:unnamed protein product [Allacma fusca]|uniref:Uncharacterized protein n=1 Tax=Allacma fusca TaxID=39272 RepID=A0A8J2NVG9_9HEXA|nr:unnamed protein product [Allacma fusca]
MSKKLLLASLIALVLSICTTARCTFAQPKPYDVIYAWNQIDFQFDSPQQREQYLENRGFIPENNAFTGIKVSGDRVFLTVARWLPGVPATLTYVSYNRTVGPQPNKSPPLIPYPSWEFNQEGNCSVIHDRSWFVQHPSMKADPDALVINIEGKNYTFETALDGIALSNRDSNFSTIYFSPLSSLNVFSISSETARQAGTSNQAGIQLKDSEVTLVGKKESQTDGMTIDANGVLYYGLLGMSGISGWNTTEARMTDANQVLVAQNDAELQWPDTFSIDTDGYLFANPNRLHRFFTKTSNFTEINFRVVRIFINSKSYMYSKELLME